MKASLLSSVLLLLALTPGPVPCEVKAQEPAPVPKQVEPAPKPAPLSIGGQLKVDPYRLVKLTAQGVAGGEFLWDVVPLDDAAAVIDWATGNDGEQIAFVAPPGRYQVELLVIRDTKPRLARKKETVVIGPEAPRPPPVDPKVDPKVDPVIPKGDIRVIFYRDIAQARPLWLDSPKVRAYLAAKVAKTNGHPDWREYDTDQVLTDQESATLRALWEQSKGLGKPGQVLVAVGTKAEWFPMPATEDDALAFLKKFGGE